MCRDSERVAHLIVRNANVGHVPVLVLLLRLFIARVAAIAVLSAQQCVLPHPSALASDGRCAGPWRRRHHQHHDTQPGQLQGAASRPLRVQRTAQRRRQHRHSRPDRSHRQSEQSRGRSVHTTWELIVRLACMASLCASRGSVAHAGGCCPTAAREVSAADERAVKRGLIAACAVWLPIERIYRYTYYSEQAIGPARVV